MVGRSNASSRTTSSQRRRRQWVSVPQTTPSAVTAAYWEAYHAATKQQEKTIASSSHNMPVRMFQPGASGESPELAWGTRIGSTKKKPPMMTPSMSGMTIARAPA